MSRVVGSFAAGDINLGAPATETLIAAPSGGTLIVGRGVDHGILWGDDVLHVATRRLGRGGSNHHAILYVLELRGGYRVRVLSWNVYVGQAPSAVVQQLARLVDDHAPHVVLLQEAYSCRKVLRSIAGYRRQQGLVGEARGCVILTRRDVHRARRRYLRMVRPWIGPVNGWLRLPRRYPAQRLRFPGGVLRVACLHFPTGGTTGRNAAAVRESIRRIKRWGSR